MNKLDAARRLFTKLVMGCLIAAVGCAPGGEPTTDELNTSESTAIELVLRGKSIDALSMQAISTPVQQPPTHGRVLRWQFTPAGAKKAISGTVEDPRVSRSEFDEIFPSELRSEVGALKLRIPGGAGRLRLFETTVDGDWAVMGEISIPRLDPDVGVSESALINPSKDLLGQPVAIAQATEEGALNLLIVGDGYTASDIGQYQLDAAALTQRLLQTDGYADYANRINVYRQDVKSDQVGVADPVSGYNPVTAFELSFGDDSARPRRCVLYEESVGAAALAGIRDRADAVSADAVVILSNTDQYGGCASPWNGVVTVTRHPGSASILAHELGHTVFRLADEYDGEQCGTYADGVNVSRDLHNLPWAWMLTTNQLPTSTGAPAHTVGAFLGANHCSHGTYRPSETCLMRGLDHGLCSVCKAEIGRFFERREGGQSGPMSITNATGGDVFVRCASNEGAGCSGWTFVGEGETRSIGTNVEGFAFVADTTTLDSPIALDQRTLVPESAMVTLYANEVNPLSPH